MGIGRVIGAIAGGVLAGEVLSRRGSGGVWGGGHHEHGGASYHPGVGNHYSYGFDGPGRGVFDRVPNVRQAAREAFSGLNEHHGPGYRFAGRVLDTAIIAGQEAGRGGYEPRYINGPPGWSRDSYEQTEYRDDRGRPDMQRMSDQEAQYRREAGPRNASQPDTQKGGLSPETQKAFDDIQSLPEGQRVDAFNHLPLNQKQEIVDTSNQLSTTLGVHAISLDANGNLDVKAGIDNLKAQAALPVAGTENSSAIRTVDPSSPDVAAAGVKPQQTLEQRAAAFKIDGIGETQPTASASKWAPPASGAEVTTKMLNEISLAKIKGEVEEKMIGQGPDQRQVFLQDGKIIGGFNKAEDGSTKSFASRDDLKTQLTASGKNLESMESALTMAQGAGFSAPKVDSAPAPLVQMQPPAVKLPVTMT